MPAQAGIQTHLKSLGSRLRGNDEIGFFRPSVTTALYGCTVKAIVSVLLYMHVTRARQLSIALLTTSSNLTFMQARISASASRIFPLPLGEGPGVRVSVTAVAKARPTFAAERLCGLPAVPACDCCSKTLTGWRPDWPPLRCR